MRKWVAFSFLALFLFQTAGFLVFFQVQRQTIKNGIKKILKEGVSDSELAIVKISINEHESFLRNFVFFDEDEFRLDGKMYDVVRVEKSSDTVTYYCLPDDKESDLFAGLDLAVSKSMTKSSENGYQLINFSNSIFSLFFVEQLNISTTDFTESDLSSYYFFSDKSWFGNPTFPPPVL